MKSDTAGNRVSGISFSVYPVAEDGTLSEALTGTTNAGGVLYFDSLPLGTYFITETAQNGWQPHKPEEWEVSAETAIYTTVDGVAGWLIRIDKNGALIQAVNERITGSLVVTKTAEDGYVQGVTFTVTGGGKTWTITTTEDGTAVKTLTGDKYAEFYEIKQRAHVSTTTPQSVKVATESTTHSFNAGDTVWATSQYDNTLTFTAYKVDKVIYDEVSCEVVYRLVDPQGIRPTVLQPESCVRVTMFSSETETAVVSMSSEARAATLAAKEKLASAALGGTAKAAAGAAQASAQTAAQTATVAASVATPVTAVAGAAVAGVEKAVKAITR